MGNISGAGGTTTSFTNTPQAKDDFFSSGSTGLNEDTLRVVFLDVMANDLGGAAKSLFSIDNGLYAGSVVQGDLLVQDTARVESCLSERSLNGARIWITADGKIGYDATDIIAQVQSLQVGQFFTDTFTYAIRLGNGTLSWATASVQISGTNDAAVITGTSTAALTETNAAQSTGGTLSATDVDSSAAFVVQTNVAGSNGYGKFSVAADGTWTYAMDTAHNEFVGGQDYTDSVTVATADGTTQVLTVTIHGTNDAAVITGTSTAALTETNAAQSTGGTLSATDVDSSAAFVVQTNVAGSNGYGKFSVAADGTWTYAMDTAHNEFVGGQDYTDSVTVATADGTTQVLTVTIHGTNDAAVITGTSTAALTETNAAQSTGGTLSATDVDSSAAFVVQTNVAGSNGYGKFSVAADGTWTYAMDTAHNEFVGGQDYTDSVTVATADGTTQVLTVTIHGTNDAAVITGTSTAALTETNAAQSTGGTLSATDVDSSAAFVVQTNVAGSNGYGKFSVAADGTWTYAMDTAHNEFVGGQDYTDSVTVATADGTTQVLTVTIHGTNDAAVITGTSTAALTETNAAQSTGGTLSATDVDSSAAFVVQTNVAGSNGYGKFSVAADGTWTYAMDTAHNEFVGGQDYTDSVTVATADGTTQVLTVTIHGTNDAAVITGTSTAALTETNAAQSTGGTLSATDVDSSAAFVVQTNVAGSNGYGKFSVAADGTWTYAMDTAHNEFVGGQDYTDSVTVATADGTTQVLTVTIHGTNDAAVITGTSTAALTETNAAQSTGGTLSATDVDSSAAFVVQTNVAGSNGYGKFSVAADGTWTYAMDTAHNEFVGGQDYTDSVTVATADGTTQVLTVTIHGTNDAAVITGTSTAALTETNAAQSTGGTLSATDVDSSAAFVVQTNVAGSNGYGKFSVAADGTWTYAMDTAHNEFVGGQDYTDSVTVATADGTTQVLTVTIHGTNDAAVITGTSTAALTETNAAQSTGGTLSATDVDSSAAFVVQTNVAGSNGYGKFSVAADGTWTYAMDTAHNEFVGGQDYTDSVTVATADGTTQVLTVTIHGTNDAAVITGTSTAALTETNAAQSTGGTLSATDVDSSAAFVVQTNVAGSNGYGKFSVAADGTWTYAMDTAHNEFVGGQDYTDSVTVATADGTTQVLTVTIHGTNDAAVITGTSTAALTETNAAQSTGGTLSATDVDSSAAFVVQTNVAGSNGYGKFSVAADGTWTYAMDTAHNEFVGGQDYTDSVTVATADGTTQVLTVTIHGTNDAAVITGTSTAALTETNAAQSTGGTLSATDVDSSAAFVVQTNVAGSNGYGKFSVAADGTWTYAMDTAHNEFVGGQDYTDSVTVATADGTTQVLTVTIHGTNDAAVITGTSTAALTETNAAQSTGGTLSATDVDSSAAFVVQTNVAGSNGYGKFSVAADGTWTYAMDTAHNEFVGGQDYTDSVTVATADGTTQVLTVTIHGTNDAAVITGTSTAALTETNAAQSTGGTLSATDVDSSAAFVVQTNVAGSNGYGKFSVAADGTWTYAMDTAHNEFVGGQDYTDSVTVATADGTTQVLTVTIHGTNDAAVITGTSTAALTETNAAQSTGGTLSATDVDSSAAFVVQTNVAGSNGYGKFSVAADGTWTYAMDTAHNEFVGGQDYTDSVTVATADGTTQVLTVTIHGTNDAAVITGTSTAALTETNAAQSTGGTLSATDVDSSAAFVVQTNVAGSNGYGKFSVAADGTWTYAMDTAHNEFVGGQDYTDSVTVATADGTTQVLTVTIHGTNDAAVITGTSTAALTETNAAQSTGGTLSATDVDSSAAFVVQTNVAGSNGYGKFSVAADGTWTYAMDTAHNEFVGGQDYTDSVTVATADGTTQVLTVTIHGTNDAAVITGTSTAALTETNAAQSTGGTLSATDVDSSAAFVVQTNVAGSNGYGKFSVAADGTWTYAMDTAHNEFVGGQDYTDSVTVATADGTTQVLTVTIHGTNDAAVITGTSTAALTETNAAQSTGGTLSATDVDSSAAFVVQTNVAGSNGYGKFSVAADGTWTYAMDTAHNEFVGGQDYTDSVTVATADGTTQVLTVTIHGTNDAAVITGTSTAALTETNAAQSTGGTLSATDVDSSAAFVVQTNVAGSNGYGKFSVAADGTWTYAMDTAHNEFVGGQDYTDSVTVATADGTTQVLTVTIHGTNDAAVITGTSTAALTETNAAQSTGGTLSATDVDSSAAFVVQTNVAGSNGYGKFSVAADGTWTYAMDTAHNEFVGGQDYTDSVTVATADGTTQVLTVTIHGTNDAAVITGTSTAALTETNAAQSTGGTLSATDVDSSAAFVVQTNVAGSNGYGKFSVAADGTWTYAMDTAHNEFVGGQDYTDSVTVATADGTTQVLTVTIHGTNDAAVITGTSTAALTETNAAQSTGGTLSATDVDSSAAFVVQTNVAGSNGYGKFSVAADGTWTYAMDTAHNEFVGGQDYTDSVTVATADGTTQVLTVTIHGTNDAAVITGTSTAALTETNAAQSTGGTLSATDVDSSAAFVVQTNVAGSNGYGKFSVAADGTWTYAMDTAHNEFVGGQDYTDSVTVATADGTTQVLTVTIHGTNDAAVITGTSTAALTETNAAQSTGGTLSATDVDSSAAFVVQTNVAGSNGYGKFSVAADGTWTYAMDTAHNEFVGGQDYTDSVTVATADGTTQVLTVTIHGTNDAAVITGTSTAALTETNAAQSTGGTLSATDVDSSAAFVVQTNVAGSNGYGKFSVAADGTWTYAMDTAHNEFVGGQDYTDSVTVATADGTTQVLTVTIHGTNDAAVITGTSTAALTETNAAQSTGGTLSATDVDSSAAFVVQTNVAGSNGYGKFSVAADGTWTYAMDTAHNEFVGGQDYTDSVTVATADGTTQVLTVTIHGTNDAAVITGTSTAALTEDGTLTAGNTLSVGDADAGQNTFQAVAPASLTGTYGTFTFSTATGAWGYTLNNGAANVQALITGQTVHDFLTVTSSDGSATRTIDVSVSGTNDAATISGTSTGSVTEDGTLTAGNTLSVGDADAGQNTFQAVAPASLTGTYGTFTFSTATGAWGYTLNNGAANVQALITGQTVHDFLTVTSSDGSATRTIDVSVNGSDDIQFGITNITSGNKTQITITFPKAVNTQTFATSDLSFVSNGITYDLGNFTSKQPVWNAGNTVVTFEVQVFKGNQTHSGTLNLLSSYAYSDGTTGQAASAANVSVYPAGASGSPISLALEHPADAGLVTVKIAHLQPGWSIDAAKQQMDGSWVVQTDDLASLTVTTPADYSGAELLDVTLSWTDVDGNEHTISVNDNVEAYAQSMPIFAWSGDDTLTGSTAADTFVFSHPIGHDTVHNFDVAADVVDLIDYEAFHSFADIIVNAADDAEGNARLALADGQSITFMGVHTADLTAANFEFDVVPQFINAGAITIGDGALLPMSGMLANSGTIEFQSNGAETLLQIIEHGLTLTGGGSLILSDSAGNTISGPVADIVLTNIDNSISGAGQIGAGSLALVNGGTILADGTNALVINTGSNVIINTGTLGAIGQGGLLVTSGIDNDGNIMADDSSLTVTGTITGAGSIALDGITTATFEGSVSNRISFGDDASIHLGLGDVDQPAGAISGFNSDDVIDFLDLFFTNDASVQYSENETGTGGTLTVSDGSHEAHLELVGQFDSSQFHLAADTDMSLLLMANSAGLTP